MTNKEMFIVWFLGELGPCDCIPCRVRDEKGSMKNGGAYPDTWNCMSNERSDAVKTVVERKLEELGLEFVGMPYLPKIAFDDRCFSPDEFWNAIKEKRTA